MNAKGSVFKYPDNVDTDVIIPARHLNTQDAKELAALLKGMPCHVNLIPVNPVKERGYQRGSRESIARFQQQLEKLGINATVRRELGSDINAACGQLRRAAEQEAQQR